MRALVCNALGDPEALVIESRPIPRPRAREVIVQVGAAAVNFPDVLTVAGLYQHKPELPFIPGMEGAGKILGVGKDVVDWRKDDCVIFGIRPGAFAEYVRVPDNDRQLMALPSGWSWARRRGLPCRRANRLSLAGPSRRAESRRDRSCPWRVGWRWSGGRATRQASRRNGDRYRQR